MTALLVASAAAVIFAALTFRMARLHQRLADLNQLVADMLRCPDLDAATELAARFIVERQRAR